MAQNRSSAVMQQRTEPKDSADDFPTPPWATRALLHMLNRHAPGHMDRAATCWEPAAGRGHMARTLAEVFRVTATDLHDHEPKVHPVETGVDFLTAAPPKPFDLIVTNPPFRSAEAFATHALGNAKVAVAIFARSAILEGAPRFTRFYRRHRPHFVFQFAERVVIWRGRLLDPDRAIWRAEANEGRGGYRKPSTATTYSWIVWLKAPRAPTQFDWIPPRRKDWTCRGDYGEPAP